MKFTSILTILFILFTFSCDDEKSEVNESNNDNVSLDDGGFNDETQIDYTICTNCIWLQNDCNGSWVLGYNIDEDISGFQLNINGADIIGAYGGAAEDANFSVSTSNQTILGFSFSGNSITIGSGVLSILDLNGSPDSISNITISNINAVELNISNYGIINCYSSSLSNTGVSQLTIFNNTITNLEIGDEIGIFDLNGIINYNDCSNERGPILVGFDIWNGEQLNIVSTGSVDLCNINGVQLSGYVKDNPLIIRIYRHQTGQHYLAEVAWEAGTGIFGELIQSINNLNLSPLTF